jgi:elongation factor G
LISLRVLSFADQGGRVIATEIPAELASGALAAREAMLEKLYDFSNELMELAVQEEPVPDDLIQRVLREACLQQMIQPVLCGSALDGIGIPPLLDAVAAYLPSPAEMPPVQGINPRAKKGKATAETRKPNNKEPFCGLVFKVAPAKTGDLSWVRVYSGQLQANSRVYNPATDKKENVAQLWRIHASRREQTDRVQTGDIVGIIGLRHSITGDTLCDAQQPIQLETIQFPDTVISMAIEPETTAERKKLADVLDMMRRQDPTFRAIESKETGQTLISGMGELHLEVIKNRLLRDFNLNVKVHKPRVSYRETIQRGVEVCGVCHRHLGGQQLFAELEIRMEPMAAGKQLVAVTVACPPEALPAEFLAAAIEELRACGDGGGLLGGFPLMRIRVSILGGKADEHSTEVAFRMAAGDAFEKGLRQGGPQLLEPVMKLDITTPEDHLGDFVGDLQQRRAIIASTASRGKMVVIEAQAPLAELFGYSSAMRSLSQGRANCSMEPLAYAPAPSEIAETFAM